MNTLITVNRPATQIDQLPGFKVGVSQTVYTTQVGNPGPAGPAGPAGPSGSTTIQLTASGAIGGHRMVASDGNGSVVYADQTISAHKGRVVGMTMEAVPSGTLVNILVGGEVDEPSWSWSPGAIYLGTNGLLTQTAPASGFLQVVGVALLPTRILIGLRIPISLL